MKEWFHVLFIFMYVSCKPKWSEISTINVFVFLGLFSADGVRALPDVSHAVRGERRHEQGSAGKCPGHENKNFINVASTVMTLLKGHNTQHSGHTGQNLSC